MEQKVVLVELTFNASEDKLTSWKITYQQLSADEEYIEDEVYSELLDLLGAETGYDDDYEVYYWEFDSHYVEAGWDYYCDYFEVYFE